jgi:hypothetical protein
MEGICENCCWWDSVGGVVGQCRRHPPTFPTVSLFQDASPDRRLIGLWLYTNYKAWCGDFGFKQLKDAVQKGDELEDEEVLDNVGPATQA